MTTPKQARQSRGDGPRIYPWPPTPPHELEVISVTSAIKAGYPKPWLVGWAARMAAEFAVDNIDAMKALVDAGQKSAAVDVIKGAQYRNRDGKADRGTIVHAAVEAYIAGTPLSKDDIDAMLAEKRVDPGLRKATYPMAQGVLAFLQDFEPEILLNEATVYSRTHEYGGTLDILGKFPIGKKRLPTVIDVKTSKSIYDEVAMQLAAYANAEFIGLDDGTEIPLLKKTRGKPIAYGVVVRPTANGRYEHAVFTLTPEVFELFLSVHTTARLNHVLAAARRPS